MSFDAMEGLKIVKDSEKLKWPPDKNQLAELISQYGCSRTAKIYGRSKGSIYYYCLKFRIPIRSHEEAVFRHPAKDFDRNPHEKMYLCGLIEDYNIYPRSSRRLRIQSGSTRPAFIELTHSVFSKWGHIRENPEFSRKTLKYYMHVTVTVNRTFDFLLDYKRGRIEFLEKNIEENLLWDYLSGLIDSEGSINVVKDDYRAYVMIKIALSEKSVIDWLKEKIGGYKTSTRGGFQKMNDNYKTIYQLIISYDNAVNLLLKIRPRHREKLLKRTLILDNLNDLRRAHYLLKKLSQRLNDETQNYQLYLRQKYIERHGKPHPLDYRR